MSEDRRRILDLLAAGKISAAEAERLLEAVGPKPEESAPAAGGKIRPKFLVVQVDSSANGQQQYGKVNVRVPFQMLRAGVKLASLMPTIAKNKVGDALREKGIDFDIDNLRPEDIEELIGAMGEMTIDVDDHNGKVRVHCE